MLLRDHIKLVEAGFRVIRVCYVDFVIRELTIKGGWKLAEGGFTTLGALKRRVSDMLEDRKIVED